MPKPPLISKELIVWLESIYQDKSPALTDSNRQIWVNVGKAEFVSKIKDVFRQQNTGNVL